MQIDNYGNIIIDGVPYDIYDYVDDLKDVESFAKALAEIRNVIDGVLDYIEDEALDRKLVNELFLHS